MTEYKPNRSGKKDFLRAVANGGTFWSVETADTPWGRAEYARAWEFKKSRLWGATCGHMSAEAVLSGYGPLYDKRPSGYPDLFDDGDHSMRDALDVEGPDYDRYQKALRDIRRKAARMVSA
ncbi:hypothetical protein [Streptomyces sp. NPDC054784]